MLRACDFAQLRGHAELGRDLLRLIGRQRLFFCLALSPDRRLESETGPVLSGNVLDRRIPRTGRSRGSPGAFQREDHLPDFDLLALFDFDVLHHSGNGGRHFDDRFVGFQFHHWLAFGNLGAR